MTPTLQNISNYINNTKLASPKNISLDDMTHQLLELKDRAHILREELKKHPQLNPRRPSKHYKNIKGELVLIEKQIKQTNRDLKKFTAIKNTAITMGKNHGKINLHGINIYW